MVSIYAFTAAWQAEVLTQQAVSSLIAACRLTDCCIAESTWQCRIEDMVVAAVISLQNPLGSGPDEICTWIEV